MADKITKSEVTTKNQKPELMAHNLIPKVARLLAKAKSDDPTTVIRSVLGGLTQEEQQALRDLNLIAILSCVTIGQWLDLISELG